MCFVPCLSPEKNSEWFLHQNTKQKATETGQAGRAEDDPWLLKCVHHTIWADLHWFFGCWSKKVIFIELDIFIFKHKKAYKLIRWDNFCLLAQNRSRHLLEISLHRTLSSNLDTALRCSKGTFIRSSPYPAMPGLVCGPQWAPNQCCLRIGEWHRLFSLHTRCPVSSPGWA